MSKYFRWVFYLVIFGIIAWGLITPSGIRGALANNIWSIDFVRHYYDASQPTAGNPPETHNNSGLLLARQALLNNDYDQALARITPLLINNDPLALDTYAQVLYLKGDYTGAVEAWSRLENKVTLEQLATDMLDKGRVDLAILCYQKLYELNPEKYTSSLALTYKNHEYNTDAIALFQKSILDYPNSEVKVHWLRYLADIYKSQGKITEAETTYRQAIATDDRDARTWRNLGLLYSGSFKDYLRAAECFEKMIELVPGEIFGYTLAANAYEKAHITDKALLNFQAALKIDPTNADALAGVERLTVKD